MTQELDLLAMIRATLESTTDGILVTNREGKVTDFNRRFAKQWEIDPQSIVGADHRSIIESVADQIENPEQAVAEVEEVYSKFPEESFHLIELKDGRSFECVSRTQRVRDQDVGRVWSYRDITERRRSEEVSSRLAAVVESSDDAIVSKTVKGTITSWNKASERIFGYTSEEAVGQSILLLIPEDLHSEETAIINRILKGERVDHFETVRRRKDGALIHVSLTVSPVRDASGRIIGASKIARDITDKKQSELALREETRALAILNRTGPAIAADLDVRHVLQTVTDAATDVSGASFGAFLYRVTGHSYLLYKILGSSREAVDNFEFSEKLPTSAIRFDDLEKESQLSKLESVFRLPKGRAPMRSYLAVPVVSRSGEVMGGLFFGHSQTGVFQERAEHLVSGIAAQAATALDNARLYEAAQQEVVARTEAQAALHESEEHLKAIFDQAAVGIATAELNGHILQVNPRCAEILGYSIEELQTLTFADVTHPLDLELTRDSLTRLREGKIDEYNLEKRYLRKDGATIWSLTSVKLLKSVAGQPQRFLGIIEDITQRKRVEEQNQELLESERHARKEAERLGHLKDEFLATLSHELRTPLTSILGWAHLIERDPSNLETVIQGIQVILQNTRLQKQLVSDLLDMSGIISGKMRLDVQQVFLPDLIEAALDSIRPTAETKGVRIETILEPVGDAIHGDPARLQQIIWNLVSNAVKFTPRGGKIQTILKRVNSHVEIVVSDTGKGINPQFLPHIFERFRQEDASVTRNYGGLGIGLSLVKQLAEMHGGRVRAASDGEGHGATFTVELPLALARVAGDEKREHPRSSLSGALEGLPDLTGVKVLVVDDEAVARDLLTRILGDCGAKVIAVASAKEATKALAAENPDVLVSDIGMPEVDGYNFIRKVRAGGNKIPAAALTAFARSEDRTKALLAGFHAHIGKPVEPMELLATIASLSGRTSTESQAD